MNDFRAEPAALRETMRLAASRVIDSGWYVLGKELEQFERSWARACGVPHCLGVGNGMDAIELALRAAGIGTGDEVITTPMTAFATVLAVLRAGAAPVLADIDPATGLLDIASAGRCLSPRTKIVLPVHLYGQLPDMDAWLDFCGSHGVRLVEDCAQAHLARWNGRVAGSFGVAGAYSFYPTKNLGALGDGGAVVATDPEIAARVEVLRNYGQSRRYVHPELGLNSRLDELQAALLAARLDWLSEFTERRRAVATAYHAGIDHPEIDLLAAPQQAESHVHHLFVLRCARRDDLQAHLQTRGVQTFIHYPVPVHRQAPCVELRRDPSGLPHSEAHARECLSLPCHPQLTDAQVAEVIDAVNCFAPRG